MHGKKHWKLQGNSYLKATTTNNRIDLTKHRKNLSSSIHKFQRRTDTTLKKLQNNLRKEVMYGWLSASWTDPWVGSRWKFLSSRPTIPATGFVWCMVTCNSSKAARSSPALSGPRHTSNHSNWGGKLGRSYFSPLSLTAGRARALPMNSAFPCSDEENMKTQHLGHFIIDCQGTSNQHSK